MHRIYPKSAYTFRSDAVKSLLAHHLRENREGHQQAFEVHGVIPANCGGKRGEQAKLALRRCFPERAI
jgi:hypothetical protein